VKQRNLYLVITLICISLAGIIAVQFLWINNAIRVKEELFNRSVNDALTSVVNRIETSENIRFIAQNRKNDSILKLIRSIGRDTIAERIETISVVSKDKQVIRARKPVRQPLPGYFKARENYIMEKEKEEEEADRALEELQSMSVQIDPLTMNIQFTWDENQILRIDSIMNSQQNLIREEVYHYYVNRQPPEDEDNVIVLNRSDIPNEFEWRPGKEEFLKQHVDKLTVKAKRIQDIIQKLTLDMESTPRALSDRIPADTLAAYLSGALAEKDIQLPYEYAVMTVGHDSTGIPVSSPGFSQSFESNNHRIKLFPHDVIQNPAQLLVYFPDQKMHVLKSVGVLMAGSGLFTLIIVMASVASIIIMIRQKKISDIKTDFINNMTHEFKTPIATISIATDSINNPKVIGEPERIKDFTRIIREENNRMNARVEQVLQMALLDSRDFRLRPVLVDMNELIRHAAGHFRLQIEKREGFLQTDLEATDPLVYADEDHMRNVLMNLLDNANKYSNSHPQIRVYTFNRGRKLIFGVEDNGIGMSPETQKKVFDKFYRVTTGNIHKIKGFGLGLSYVKAIVLAHQGEIQVFSETDKGSRFEISLQSVPDRNENE